MDGMPRSLPLSLSSGGPTGSLGMVRCSDIDSGDLGAEEASADVGSGGGCGRVSTVSAGLTDGSGAVPGPLVVSRVGLGGDAVGGMLTTTTAVVGVPGGTGPTSVALATVPPPGAGVVETTTCGAGNAEGPDELAVPPTRPPRCSRGGAMPIFHVDAGVCRPIRADIGDADASDLAGESEAPLAPVRPEMLGVGDADSEPERPAARASTGEWRADSPMSMDGRLRCRRELAARGESPLMAPTPPLPAAFVGEAYALCDVLSGPSLAAPTLPDATRCGPVDIVMPLTGVPCCEGCDSTYELVGVAAVITGRAGSLRTPDDVLMKNAVAAASAAAVVASDTGGACPASVGEAVAVVTAGELSVVGVPSVDAPALAVVFRDDSDVCAASGTLAVVEGDESPAPLPALPVRVLSAVRSSIDTSGVDDGKGPSGLDTRAAPSPGA